MNNQARFLSLSNPDKYGYLIFAKGECNQRSHRPLCDWAYFYETYGDSQVQHSKEVLVQDEMFADFLGSLAAYLKDHPEDVEMVAKHWPNYLPTRSRILFLAGLRHKDGKTQYYHKTEDKVSSAENRRHDKRWEVVPDTANGTARAVIQMLGFQGSYVIDWYARWDRVDEVLRDNDGSWTNVAKELNVEGQGWTDQAWSAVDGLVKAFRQKEHAERYLESYKSNVENAKQKKSA